MLETLPSVGGTQNYKAGTTQETNLQTNFKPCKHTMTINLIPKPERYAIDITCFNCTQASEYHVEEVHKDVTEEGRD